MAGGIVTAAKAAIKGEDPFPHISMTNPLTPAKGSSREDYYRNVTALMINAVDRSGILGIMADPMQWTSKMGYDPVTMLTGEGSLGRSKSRPALEMLFGPSAGKFQTLFEAAGSTIGLATGVDPLTPAATKDYMALIPYQNLLPFTLVANTAFSLFEAHDKADRHKQRWTGTPFSVKTPADFYYDQFKFIEHRLAPMFVETDYSDYDPRTAIIQ